MLKGFNSAKRATSRKIEVAVHCPKSLGKMILLVDKDFSTSVHISNYATHWSALENDRDGAS